MCVIVFVAARQVQYRASVLLVEVEMNPLDPTSRWQSVLTYEISEGRGRPEFDSSATHPILT